MSQLINQLYAEQLTEQGLAELRAKYPTTLVMDMAQDAEFKAARKIRTERNQLVEKIETRRKGVQAEIKTRGDSLIVEVDKIFNPIITKFELEDASRKKEAARLKLLEDEKIKASKLQIQKLHSFITQCNGKDAEYIGGMIESVDLIEVESFHKETIHEAIEVKKATLAALTQLLSDTIAREKLAAERDELAKEKAKLDEEKAEFDAWKLSQKEALPTAESKKETVNEVQKPTSFMKAPIKRSMPVIEHDPIAEAYLSGFMAGYSQEESLINPELEAGKLAKQYSNDKAAA